MAAILVMAAIGTWAVVTDRIGYVVTYGISMEPVYHANDLVFIMKADSYEVGQIAAYHGSGGRLQVLHRIVGGDPTTGFVLKGDNNASLDAERPTADRLIGHAILHLPHGGTWLKPLLSPSGLGVFAFLFVGGGAAAARTRRDIPRGRRKKKVKSMSGGGGGSWSAAAAVVKAVKRLHPVLRGLAVVTVLCGVLGFALGVLGFMKPATEVGTDAGRDGETMTFSYSAEVPRSAAYDGTTVYSPDPVFRKLTNLIILRMNYDGEPGRIRVDARLSAQNGWRTDVQLAQEKQFSAVSFTETVQLDLAALEKRALDAGKAIGVDMGAITLAVTAQVRHGDGSVFAPQLSLSLAPLALTLTGGAETLTVDHSGAAGPATSIRDRMIGAFGHDLLTAAEARRYAAYLLLLTVVGTIVIAMMALRHVPLRTRAQIERRYPHLIVPVEPMASPPGKPVVSVETFPALVKLAERYGQMILTWTRPDGADDFVVRDEGITYRFRIPASAPVPVVERAPQPLPATPAPAPAPAAALPAAPADAIPETKAAPADATPETKTATADATPESKTASAESKAEPEPAAGPEAPTTPGAEPAEKPEATTTLAAEPEPAPVKATKAPAKRARRPRPKPEPKQTDPEPAQVDPEPKQVDPEPKQADPEPKEANSEPKQTADPEPKEADSEPKADDPKPKQPAPRRRPSPRKQTPPKAKPEKPEPTAEPDPVTVLITERQAVEDLATANEKVDSGPDEQPAIYDFLPPPKRKP